MTTKKKILSVLVAMLIVVSAYFSYSNYGINDIGLKVLSWVKGIRGDAVDLDYMTSADSPAIQHHAWTELLNQHITEAGLVNYQGFIQDSLLLNSYLAQVSQNPPSANWTESEQLAYWINAYNAFTVKLIIKHYPLSSIKDIADGLPMINSPWDIKFFKIGNSDFDLNTIEHEILRKEFNEPRIHFAINCASISCPKLRNEAFSAEMLDGQLDEQARQFINDPQNNILLESGMKLSKIFDWFKNDFIRSQMLPAYLQKFTSAEISGSRTKIEYMDYDWNLNEAVPNN